MTIKCAEVFQENVFSWDTASWRRCHDLLTAVSKGSTKAEEAILKKPDSKQDHGLYDEDV